MGKSPLVVRDAGPADADALSVVGSDSFLAAYGETSDPQAIAEHIEADFSPDSIRAEMARANCTYMIATIGDSATGLMKLRADSVPDQLSGCNALELQQLYVHSDFQGYGVGRALVDAALSFARTKRYEAIWLQAWSKAEWALAFYERNLFRRIGEIPFFVGEQEFRDCLMLRELNELGKPSTAGPV